MLLFSIMLISAMRKVTMFGLHSIDQKLNEVSYSFFSPLGSAVSPSEANSPLFLDNLAIADYFDLVRLAVNLLLLEKPVSVGAFSLAVSQIDGHFCNCSFNTDPTQFLFLFRITLLKVLKTTNSDGELVFTFIRNTFGLCIHSQHYLKN